MKIFIMNKSDISDPKNEVRIYGVKTQKYWASVAFKVTVLLGFILPSECPTIRIGALANTQRGSYD